MDRLVPHVIISTLKNKKSILRSNGKLVRDYIFVDDVARAYLLLMKKMIKKREKLYIYNLGSKENLTVLQLVKLIIKKIKNKNLKPKILNNTTKIEIKRQKLNYSKIRKDLGWKPLWTLNDAIEVTIDWYKKNIKLFS